MKIQLIVVVVKRRVGPNGQSCGQFAVSPTKKVAVFIQMPGVMFQTSLVETSERIKFSPIGLVTRQVSSGRILFILADSPSRSPSFLLLNHHRNQGPKLAPGNSTFLDSFRTLSITSSHCGG